MRAEDEDEDEAPRTKRTKKASAGIAPWVWVVGSLGAVTLLGRLCAGALFLVGFIGGLADARKEANIKATDYKKITADQLLDEWKPNPAVASEKYAKQPIELHGTLKRVDAVGGAVWLDIQGQDGSDWAREVRVVVDTPLAKENLKKRTVKKGVVVKGRSDGKANEKPWIIAEDISPAD